MKKELEKYNPGQIEDRIYETWNKKGYFKAEVNPNKKPFTIIMPPPNITGQLHMGHALDNTMQDIIVRFKRMEGYETLWQAGTDHASIATEAKIVAKLKEEGKDKKTIGREKFLKRAWKWKEEYGGRIISQLKKLGSSCDWERERFTMDEGCSEAVKDVFVKLYNKKLIYKGSRLVNWCPKCNTSISDAEVEHEEKSGYFWHIKYPLMENGKPSKTDFLEFATTRPETMLGDTAVAVNPNDERYRYLKGKTVWLPIANREIPVIEDEYVDMEFGTGVVKITPAHDPNDFEVGKRHNLPEINIMNDNATINENGGKYEGLDRYEARKQIVEELKSLGLLVKIEDHIHNVGTCYRCHSTVEPLIKEQWFVKMDEMIKLASNAVKNGEVKLIPERMDKTFFNWTDNIKDWCISRQLWWGHRIPAWYCDCGEIIVSKEAPNSCPKCGGTHLKQDKDTLDTWFSSALWPFSTLGWPKETSEYKYFYPTDVLVTGYDIIFFWVIRMIFSAFEHTGKAPFNTVIFHGLVRDSQGRKMSKSLGNGIDPLEIIDKYGADALRFSLMTGNAPGNDMRFYNEKVEAGGNFANKVWNASKFIMMNLELAKVPTDIKLLKLTPADKWILSKVNKLALEVTDNMDSFELGIALQKVYDFIWEEFCDWYIEMVKPRLYSDTDETKAAALFTLKTVLISMLKLLHPFMPFVTEEIYQALRENEPDEEVKNGMKESIMVSTWPTFNKDWNFEKEEKEVALIKEAVKSIRAIRTKMNVPPSRKAKVIVVAKDDVGNIFKEGEKFFASLSYASEVIVQKDKAGIDENAVSAVISKAVMYIPFSDLVDIDRELERLDKEHKRLEGEIKRSNGMLNNEKFISKAPESKVNEEKEKLVKYTEMLKQVEEQIKRLKNV